MKIKSKKAVKNYSETSVIINRRDKFTIKNLKSYRLNNYEVRIEVKMKMK